MNLKKIFLFVSLFAGLMVCITQHSIVSAATLEVYPPLPGDLYKSDRYIVTVSQNGNAHNSYVYQSSNNSTSVYGDRPYMTDTNNFTAFSFSGAVTVQVKLPLRISITSVEVRPLIKNVTATWSGNTISVPLSTAGNYYVYINGEEKHPLFIFANPVEINPPASSGDANVSYLEPGVHTIVSTAAAVFYFKPGIHDIDMSGGTFQNIPSGKTIYLAGGAYVRGLMKSAAGGNLTVRGRGILSGIKIATNKTLWGNFMISAEQTTLNAEGIIVTDSPQATIVSYKSGGQYDNIKMLGWNSMGDGISTGANAVVKNCFTKLNDDQLKPAQANFTALNNVAWIQTTGSAIQLGWNSVSNVANINVDGFDVVGHDLANWSGTKMGNFSVVSLRNINGATYQGTIQNVRSDVKVYQVFGMQIKDTMTGYTQGLGTVDGLVFKNFNIPIMPQRPSVFNGNGTNTGEIKNITFDNVNIGGIYLTNDNAPTYLTRLGLTSGFTYIAPQDTTAPTVPAALAAVAISSTQINLSWNASTDDVGIAGYRLDMSTDSVFNSFVAGYNNSDLGNVLAKSVTGLSASTQYYARVSAYDSAGKSSLYAMISTTTQPRTAVTYYVATTGSDTNPGTIDKPWFTIKTAASKLAAGDTLYVRGGIYKQYSVTVSGMGSESSPIKVMAYPGEFPVLDGEGLGIGPWYGFFGLSGQYIQLSGFEVKNGGVGVYIEGPHNTVSNMNVHHTLQNGILAKGDYSVVEKSSVSWSCLDHYNYLVGNGGTNGWASGLSSAREPVTGITKNAIIRGNWVFNNWGEGLSAYEAEGTVIENNVVYDNWALNVYISDARNVFMSGNLVYNTPNSIIAATGARSPGNYSSNIVLADERSDKPRSANNTVINNLTYNGNIQVFAWTIVTGSALDNALVANNTFVNGKLSTGPLNLNSRIKNNIIYRNDGGELAAVPTKNGLTLSNNLWLSTPPAGASGTGDRIGDPLLAKTGNIAPAQLSAGYFKIVSQLSPAINAATPLSEVDKDYFNIQRGISPDIGAHEYIPAVQAPRGLRIRTGS